MKRVMFVCTGNVFRSMIAEKCLKDYLKKNKIYDLKIDSSGISDSKGNVNKFTFDALKKLKINSFHKPKKITENLIKKSDLIISMGKNHRQFLIQNFGVNSFLFNELAYRKSTGIMDIEEKYKLWNSFSENEKKEKQREYIPLIVNHIYFGTPKLAKKILKVLKI